MYDQIRVCPNCRGNGYDPNGGLCEVCQGAGALYRGDGAPAKDADAEAFFDDYRERKYGKEARYGV
jgi:hypothetical protein